MFRTAPLALLLAGFGISPAQADQTGFDFDTLAACSTVYQEIGVIYGEQGNAQKQAEFQDTGYAYSAAAFHMLKYETSDMNAAWEYSQGRMQDVVDSLNKSAQEAAGGKATAEAMREGEMQVINEWLPYCDTLGSGVNSLLARREESGW